VGSRKCLHFTKALKHFPQDKVHYTQEQIIHNESLEQMQVTKFYSPYRSKNRMCLALQN
jgi:hypothetical protein